MTIEQARVAMLREIRPPRQRPFRIETVAVPPLEPGAMLVKIAMAGVCGTDVHILHGKVPMQVPAILGHENVARVTAIGGMLPRYDITGRQIAIGDLITWLPKSCMQCYNCTILGDQAKCERRIGYGGWLPATRHPYLVGGFAAYAWLLPHSDVVVIPPDIRPEAVVLGDALRIMVHGLERIGGVHYGDTVVIQGSGAVGMMGMLLARDAGAGTVIVIGAPAARLELARAFGADEVLDISTTTSAERIARILALTHGRGADLVLECAGVPAAVTEGLEMVRIDGRYVIAGHYGDAGSVMINPHLINKKQITITGAWSAANRHFLRGLSLLRKLEVDRLVTHRYGLDEINEALIAAEGQAVLKAVIIP
ncbi:MAG TPA: zinc-binding dehydrogenase [Roseiflexaceae bacterium]|nr:zinc-binding dehydrogenase [Roseiflexaceae bacterium]